MLGKVWNLMVYSIVIDQAYRHVDLLRRCMHTVLSDLLHTPACGFQIYNDVVYDASCRMML